MKIGPYDHRKIEPKLRKIWTKPAFYKTPDKVKGKDNFYLLVEFPYPSGNLHVGHWYAFAVPDIFARMQRMKGKNVMYPIGFDAFGLPAENAAIKNGLNPRKWTQKNIAYMKKQIGSMGTSFDWSRAVSTIDPAYYKWTQWLFLQLHKNGLVYQKKTPVNWCPKDKTVLANEQVIDGKCERCGSEVIQREMLQWNIKITNYADRLIDDLAGLDWPEQIKESQRNWIGRTEGYEIDFPLTFGSSEKKYTYVFLHGFSGSPEEPRYSFWKAELEKQGHTVVIPRLPDTEQPSESAQVAAALSAARYDENTVLVGHSLGAVVALKVLEKLDTPIARLLLVGGFVDPKFKDHARNFEKRFKWKFDAKKIRANAGTIQLLHDSKDYAIAPAQLQRLEELLQVRAEVVTADEPHFTGATERTVLMWLRPTIRVFTTRPDTLFGGTFLVLAPEHPWVTLALEHKTVLKNNDEVASCVLQAKKRTELERQTDQKEKTGVELRGVKAINPTTGQNIPIWIADYALMGFGTGALFGDAHDERDVVFAKKYGIALKETIEPLFVQRAGVDASRPNEPFVHRDSILAFVKHWSEDKYLGVHYKPTNINECVSGGIEPGEEPVTAAKREIREETGYTNARFMRNLGGKLHTKYFSLKYGNLFVHFTPLLFQLEDNSQVEVEAHERENHDVSWLTRKEMEAFLNREDMRCVWQRVHEGAPFEGKGILFDSGEFNGLTSDEAIPKVGAKFGRMVRQYRLRDWIVSRQRYWGVPIPIIHCPTCGIVPVPDKDLPVKLPEVKDYLPEGSGRSPLAKVKKWVNVKCPKCKAPATRETDTLDTFVDSSWYFLRYTDPKNKKKFADAKKMANWMPVDLYSGGAEHTTMHVLYSRFWQKALFDLGLVADAEPYTRRMNHSVILGPDGQKMSKSHGNVIDPDKVVAQFGADTVRMYLAFIGPYNEVASYPWNPDGVVGVRRFLERVWRAQSFLTDGTVPELEPALHRTIRKIGDDIGLLKFNTAIAQLMIFLNETEKQKKITRSQWDTFIKLLAPFAPFMAETLWSNVGHKSSVHDAKWPEHDPELIRSATRKIAVQINGKTRGEAEVQTGADSNAHQEAAQHAVGERLLSKKIARIIVVPGRLVNFVVEE